MLKKINFQINGMHCQGCQTLIESAVKVLPGIKNIHVNNKTGHCRLEYDDSEISLKKITKEIEKLKYQVVLPGDKTSGKGKKNIAAYTIIGIFSLLMVAGYFLITSSDSNGQASVDSKKTEGNGAQKQRAINDGFLGDRGVTLAAQNNQLLIDESTVNDGNLHAFNYFSADANKNIYFFVVKAPDGTYRAAANACEVCYGAKKGFALVGDLIRCENCRVTYPKSKIAVEKGGCNPGPIDKNVQVNNGELVINAPDVEAVSYLF